MFKAHRRWPTSTGFCLFVKVWTQTEWIPKGWVVFVFSELGFKCEVKQKNTRLSQENGVKFWMTRQNIKIQPVLALTAACEFVWFVLTRADTVLYRDTLSAGSKPCFLYLSLEQVCTHRHESSAVLGTASAQAGIKMPGTKLSRIWSFAKAKLCT